MTGVLKLFRIRFPWSALLSLVVAVAGACSRARGQDVEIAPRVREATTAPTRIVTPAAATAPTAVNTPTARAALTWTAAPAATMTPSIPPPGPLSGERLASALRGGGYVIYFRHAETDPVPDDANPVVLSDCSTQRNLSNAGKIQAQEIGQAIARLEIPVGSVLSSPFCRALDTARIAFGRPTSEPALENLETAGNEAEREARIEGLRRLLSTAPDGATNSILVGHGFNISAAAEVAIAEGEAAIFRPDGEGGFTLVATVTSLEWGELLS